MSIPASIAIKPARKPPAPKTTAERGFVEAFSAGAKELPGDGWVARVRQDAIASFEAMGLPTRRVEAFKYTDLRERLKVAHAPAALSTIAKAITAKQVTAALGALGKIDCHRLVFVDGIYHKAASSIDASNAAFELLPLGGLLAKAPAWLAEKFQAGRLGEGDAVTALNAAFMSDGVLLKIKAGMFATKPVLIVAARSSVEPRSVTMRNIIKAEAGATATVIECHVSLAGAAPQGLTNTLSDVEIEDGANLTHIKCAQQAAGATHLANWIVTVGKAASYRAFQMTSGNGLARNGLVVTMAGEGSKLDISGAFLGREAAHIDTTLVVDHAVPGGESRELFKGVLDERARGVFQGKVIVRPGADKTDGKQMARALMLSPDAEFDSKPELEIYADDVACGHGATVAELDADLMFYCQSRGIPLAQARGLLIEAFIGEAVDKIENEAIREAVMQIARDWLAAEAANPGRDA